MVKKWSRTSAWTRIANLHATIGCASTLSGRAHYPSCVKSADASSRDHRLRRMTRIREGVAGRAAERTSRKQVVQYSCARRHNRRNMTPEVNGR
jgi:hypothetical protein